MSSIRGLKPADRNWLAREAAGLLFKVERSRCKRAKANFSSSEREQECVALNAGAGDRTGLLEKKLILGIEKLGKGFSHATADQGQRGDLEKGNAFLWG